MGHLTSRDAYKNLEDRLNWFTQGAPSSETLTKILGVLFTEKEAKWVSKLPIRPFTLKRLLSSGVLQKPKLKSFLTTSVKRGFWSTPMTVGCANSSCLLR